MVGECKPLFAAWLGMSEMLIEHRLRANCCSLFGTPLWLCALYVPEMSVVNRYYIPPLWYVENIVRYLLLIHVRFVPSIFLIEACLIFVPCWQVVKNNRLQCETLEIIAEWESKNGGNSLSGQTLRSPSRASKDLSTKSVASSRRCELYTMRALESCIRVNPEPLLLFAALKDFSGENISFLTKIVDWKRGWSPSSPIKSGFPRRPSVHDVNNRNIQRQQFKRAIDIYASYVSLKYSDYPINISHTHLKELEAVFEGAAMTIYGHLVDESDSNSATPFENFASSFWQDDKSNSSEKDIEAHPRRTDGSSTVDTIFEMTDYNASNHQNVLKTFEVNNAATEYLPEYVPVSPDFGPHIFDHAEESIKYMVLTNTWHKFVNAGYQATETRNKKSFTQGFWRKLSHRT